LLKVLPHFEVPTHAGNSPSEGAPRNKKGPKKAIFYVARKDLF
jgi:hypothetical protein